LNALDETVAVERLLPQHLEDHHLQRPGKKILAVARFRAHSCLQGYFALGIEQYSVEVHENQAASF
jgi:hypothetical protein